MTMYCTCYTKTHEHKNWCPRYVVPASLESQRIKQDLDKFAFDLKAELERMGVKI